MILKNAKHEKFVQNLINGMTQRQAYKDAFKVNYDEKAIDSKASTLFNSEKVQERYKELTSKLEDKSIMSAKERMELLTEIAAGIKKEMDKVETLDGKFVDIEKESSLTTRMKALDILNKMSGEYVQKIEADVSNDITINIELNDDE